MCKIVNVRREEVRRGKFIALAGSVVLVLALVLSACAQQAAPTTPGAPASKTTAQEKTYKTLNPKGDMAEIALTPLSPRPTELKGMTIYIYGGETGQVIFGPLWDRVNKVYPTATSGVTWKNIRSESFGAGAVEQETKDDLAKLGQGKVAVIRGNAW